MEVQKKVIKTSGETVDFNENKLRFSLMKSGATESTIEDIISQIKLKMQTDLKTKDIHKIAHTFLSRKKSALGARYKLKKAIIELGPTGFPFEKYIGKIISSKGYKTEVGVILQGNCVSHEVDVLARKGNVEQIIECKFHSEQSRNCNVKVPLYINSRFEDIKRNRKNSSEENLMEYEGWIYTNTRFSGDAIQYGKCIGLNLVGWDYPQNNSLKEQVDNSGLYPITCLSSITDKEKETILSKGIVICKDLLEKTYVFKSANISEKRQTHILREVESLCFFK